jgi:formylglycine-generating enzyme required for sulfatase activity/tRNA A-37 threonylcarbamoyl transferase component Bud32
MPEPTPTAIAQFLEDYQFLSRPQAQELRKMLPQFRQVALLIKELIRRGWLTPYQGSELLEGSGSNLVLGPYRFLEQVGEGGMGRVYKARHVRMDRLVALKVIHKAKLQGASAVERFNREARAAGQLSHPNIVVAHDSDEIDGRHFLAMEYVDGTDLATRIKQFGPLPVAQACEFARQAALGLQHAHERGVVHRDIKPSNLIVARGSPGTVPVVKILDFGLARFESEATHGTRLTQLGSIFGTLDFMSPEQADNARNADIRSDIYSLGCTLWFLLTGKPPFPGEDAVTRLAARLQGDPPSPRTMRPEIPPALENVLAKMMARLPGHRYQTPAEVAAALEPIARPAQPGLPVSVKSPPMGRSERSVPTAGYLSTPRPSMPQAVAAKDDARTLIQHPLIKSRRRDQQAKNGHWLLFVGPALAVLLGVVLVGALRLWPPGNRDAASTNVQAKVTSRPPSSVETTKRVTAPTQRKTTEPKPDPAESKKEKVNPELGATQKEDPKTDEPPNKRPGPDTKPEEKADQKFQPVKEARLQPTHTNDLGIEFVLVPRGKSWLGGGGGKPGSRDVEILHDFYLGKYEVTQEEWEKLMGSNPSFFSRTGGGKETVKSIPDGELKRFPVETVSWEECQAFIAQLNQKLNEKGWVYRLPTEVEWEYACRGGPLGDKGDGAFDFYFEKPTNQLLPDQAKFGRVLDQPSCKVGTYQPNPLGLYDMHGNVWEWCDDGGPEHQAARGGSWHTAAEECRAANSNLSRRSARGADRGLRLARVPVGKEVAKVIAPEDKNPPEEAKLPPVFTNSIGIEFVLVPKGKSWLGGGGGNPGNKEVEITHDFYLGKYEVTQEEWRKVMGANPSFYSRTGGGKKAVRAIPDSDLKRLPVEMVSWADCQAFITRLNQKRLEKGWVYRLPTEVEWEYACRGGSMKDKSESAFYFYFEKPANLLLPGQANFYHAKSPKRPSKAGSYKPNRLGLYDMVGNVWEWCQDGVTEDKGASLGVLRGGGFSHEPNDCRAARRSTSSLLYRDNSLGLRVARVLPGNVPQSLTGYWAVNYPNGVTRIYVIDQTGKVEEHGHNLRESILTRFGAGYLLDFSDGKIEYLSLNDTNLRVEHFDPRSRWPSTSPGLIGSGLKRSQAQHALDKQNIAKLAGRWRISWKPNNTVWTWEIDARTGIIWTEANRNAGNIVVIDNELWADWNFEHCERLLLKGDTLHLEHFRQSNKRDVPDQIGIGVRQ